jgi:hypothetical protein
MLHLAGTKKELLQYDGPLSEVDPDIAAIISNEKKRQVLLAGKAVEPHQHQQHAARPAAGERGMRREQQQPKGASMRCLKSTLLNQLVIQNTSN